MRNDNLRFDWLRWFLMPFLVGAILGFARKATSQTPDVCQDLLGFQHEEFPIDDLVPLVP